MVINTVPDCLFCPLSYFLTDPDQTKALGLGVFSCICTCFTRMSNVTLVLYLCACWIILHAFVVVFSKLAFSIILSETLSLHQFGSRSRLTFISRPGKSPLARKELKDLMKFWCNKLFLTTGLDKQKFSA